MYKCGINFENWYKRILGINLDNEEERRWDNRVGMKSGSFLRECQFETLNNLLSETVEQMVQTKRRMNLYLRVSGIN